MAAYSRGLQVRKRESEMAHASSTDITFATAIVHEDLTAGGPKKVDTTEHYELHNKALGLLLETLKHRGFTGFQTGNAETSNATRASSDFRRSILGACSL